MPRHVRSTRHQQRTAEDSRGAVHFAVQFAGADLRADALLELAAEHERGDAHRLVPARAATARVRLAADNPLPRQSPFLTTIHRDAIHILDRGRGGSPSPVDLDEGEVAVEQLDGQVQARLCQGRHSRVRRGGAGGGGGRRQRMEQREIGRGRTAEAELEVDLGDPVDERAPAAGAASADRAASHVADRISRLGIAASCPGRILLLTSFRM